MFEFLGTIFQPKTIAAFLMTTLAGVFTTIPAYAEGTFQAGLNQPFVETNATAPGAASTRDILVDIVTAGEVINISACGAADTNALAFVIETPSGTVLPTYTPTALAGKILCANTMSAPITTPYRYTTTAAGRYKVRLINVTAANFNRFDVTVTANATVNPDPTNATGIKGRVSSLAWQYSTGAFSLASATNADYYVLAPGGYPNTNYVWQLDLNALAGNAYGISANNKGVNAPRSGFSTDITGNAAVPQFQNYLNYPAIAGPPPSSAPAVTGFRFIDSAGQDYGISPGLTAGVQDTGTFEFTTAVDNATYSISIDVNKNGIFGDAGDVRLTGNVVNGFNSIVWDGKNNSGVTLPVGSYQARAEVRLGEFHFIANDVETSGGTQNGLTVYEATSPSTLVPTQVYWDDVTVLGVAAGGTANTPLGALSGTAAGYHTWGTFDAGGGGFGNNRFVDTFAFGKTTQASLFVAIVGSDAPLTGNNGAVTITPTSKPGDILALSVTDADLNSLSTIVETVLVSVRNNVTGETESVTLTETGANTGIFTGSVPTTFGAVAGPNNNGALSTQATDTVTVTYNDALSATGTAVARTADDVVSGGTTGTVSITPSSGPGDTLTIGVTDADLNANPLVADTVIVTLVNSVTGEIETVTLTETGPNTGIFAGTLPTVASLVTGTNNNGSMNVKAADTVVVTYADARAANGGPASSTATNTINSSNPLVATNDTIVGVDATLGAANLVNAFNGDLVNLLPATAANAVLSIASGSAVPAGLTFNTATGAVGVVAGTTAGTYSFVYQICEAANPPNCRTATVSVIIVIPVAPIVATDDTATGADGVAGATNVLNAFTGDAVNNIAATNANSVLSVATGFTVPTSLSFDTTTGNTSVLAGTAPGTYSFDYQICEATNPANCTTATISITVAGLPVVIVATADSATAVDGVAGAANVVNAFTGDTIGGAAATSANAVLSPAPGFTVPAGLTFDTATGNVSVAAGTAAGTYSFDYQTCEIGNPANCQTASISVTVGIAAAVIITTDDSAPGINGASGATTILNVFAGDTLDGAAATVTNATLSVAPGFTVPAALIFDPVTGDISVAAGTAAGTYSFDYQICETAVPANCETATASVTVVAAPLVAIADSATGVNGASGAANVVNAFTGDTLNGAAATTANSTLSVATGSAVPAGLTFDTATGTVSVAAGTPAGSYSFDYQICEALNPANCQVATISVTVDAAPLVATADTAAAVNGASGAANVINVLGGDTLDGNVATPSTVTLNVASGSSVPAGLIFDPATGNVSAAAATPAGTYGFTYSVCEILNPANCQTATVSVVIDASVVAATNITATGVIGATGANSAANVLTGNTVNGDPATTANAILSVAVGSVVPSGLGFDTATGGISVAPGTPAGIYSFDYQICEALNPANCQTATVSITVVAAPLVATSDSATSVNGASGASNVLNVFDADTVNGTAASATNALLSVATGSTVPTGLTFDTATGNVGVPAATPAGTYSFDYQICEALNPANCQVATASVTVGVAAVVATADTASAINGANGSANAVNVFTGDTVNGAAATSANSTLSVATGSTVPAGLTFDTATGNVSVAAGTPAGSYSFDYQICEALNPANCQVVMISVTVDAAPLVATGDSVSGVNGASGAAKVVNAFASDTVNGLAATSANAVLAVAAGSTVPVGLAFDTATGDVSVAAGTTAGTYSFNYQLCEQLNPTNCQTATISVTVDASAIIVSDDAVSFINGASGAGYVLNVLAGDTVNGAAATIANAILSVAPGSTVPVGLTFDPATGNVSVIAGTAAGTYSFDYQLCEALNPANCQTASASVTVDVSAIAVAADNANAINGASGSTNVVNAFTGDTINGAAATSANAVLSVATGSAVPAGLVFDTATGQVDVLAGTPAGTYSFDYQICEALNPGNCRISMITIVVDPSAIIATPDSVAAINGASGAVNVVNAFAGDSINGTAATSTNAVLSVAAGSTVPTGLTLDTATGNVSVAAGTPAGSYTFDYQICEQLNPTNCQTASISVVVEAAAVVASPDVIAAVNGASGAANIVNVFSGDTVNGTAADTSNALLSVATGSAVPAGLTFDTATGNVGVASGTPAGTYSFDYQICEILNPTNCQTATVSVTVAASIVVAGSDAVAGVNGASGASNIVNVLNGDTVDGVAATTTNAVLSVAPGSTVPVGLTLDIATGNVSVAAGTPAGTYAFDYQICEQLNPSNCQIATASLIIDASALAATADAVLAVNGASGGVNAANAFNGDTVNGASANATNAVLSVAAGFDVPAGLIFDAATGNVSVTPGTPAGTYSFDYQICEALNPANCETAAISIGVDPSIVATNNIVVTGVNGVTGAPSVANILGGNVVNGVPATLANATLSVAPGSAVPAGLTFDPATGIIGVAPATPAGTYSFDYQICETLNPANCQIATITITVDATDMVASADSVAAVNGASGANNIVNTFGGDTINGDPASSTNATLSVAPGSTVPAGLIFDAATGNVSVAAGTVAGTYGFDYQICEILNQTNCRTASISVSVVVSAITASSDSATGINGATGASTVLNVLTGDSVNGVAATIANASLSLATGSSVPAGLTFDAATGNVGVTAASRSGTYSFDYQICEILNPANCQTATASVTVVSAALVATADSATGINGASGAANVVNVFAGDLLNGAAATAGNTVLRIAAGSAIPAGLAFDTAKGNVSVNAATPAGTYAFDYQICEILNPTNCQISTVSVTVVASNVTAIADSVSDISGATGAANVLNVLTGDTVNGVAAAPSNAVLSIAAGSTVPTGIAFDAATGLVKVAARTPAGTYSFDYQICEALNPANCQVATASVTVVNPGPVAADDATTVVRGQSVVIAVLANDSEPGGELLTVTTATARANGSVAINTDGTITYTPVIGFVGTDSFIYTICDPAMQCTSATVSVIVHPSVSALTGTVFLDLEGDSVKNASDPRQPDWLIEIMRDGVVVATARTDATGNYNITGLPLGAGYSVVFRHPTSNVVYGRTDGITLNPGITAVDLDRPIDPSGVVYDSVERTPITGARVSIADGNGALLPTACLLDLSQQNQITGADGRYRFDVVPGGAAQCPTAETAYRLIVAGPADTLPGNSTVILANAGPFDPTGLASGAVVTNFAAPQGADNTRYFFNFRLASGDPDVIHNHIPLDRAAALNPLVITKTSAKRTANVGDLVPYTIVVRNTQNIARNGVDVVDLMPAGFKYVNNTGRIGAVEVAPVANGRELNWRSLNLPANGSLTISLVLTVGSGVNDGDYTNIATGRDALSGRLVSNEGQATVRVTPSPLFDCGEIIGKVFDDRNGNGYQDDGELGIAGARVATVNGLLITADQYGRYHVTCAAVPNARIGSNFILKLDPGSLPGGYQITTENPRVVRLTRGKITELNFGATLQKAIMLELTADAFEADGSAVKQEWQAKLQELITSLQAKPSIVRLHYIAVSIDDVRGEERLKALSEHIQQMWRKTGEDRALLIERISATATPSTGKE
jgi:large repetitive protein